MRKLLIIPSILLISNCFAEEVKEHNTVKESTTKEASKPVSSSDNKELKKLLLKIENLNREEELLEKKLKRLLGKLDKNKVSKKKKVLKKRKRVSSKKQINNSDIIELQVREGDTLQALAKYFYGDESKFIYIYSKDKSLKIKKNRILTPGIILILPGINEK